MVMSKMGKWKYSTDQFSDQILESLLKIVKQRWDFARQTTLDIFEKTLRKLMLSLSDKEVKESIKKNEEKLTLRFNTCLILINNTKDVVTTATKTWKNIYYLHKPSDFVVQVEEEEEEEEKEEEIEIDNIEEEYCRPNS